MCGGCWLDTVWLSVGSGWISIPYRVPFEKVNNLPSYHTQANSFITNTLSISKNTLFSGKSAQNSVEYPQIYPIFRVVKYSKK